MDLLAAKVLQHFKLKMKLSLILILELVGVPLTFKEYQIVKGYVVHLKQLH